MSQNRSDGEEVMSEMGMTFAPIDPAVRAELLRSPLNPPGVRVSVVIDTDTANEIDDQFTLAWALLSPEVIDLLAVIAEPFSFAHHRAPLLAAEAALGEHASAPTASPPKDSVFLEDYGAWAARLVAAGTAVTDLQFTSPTEGVEASVREIQRVFAAAGVAPDGRVFRGADHYMVEPTSPVQSSGVDRLIELARESTGVLYVVAIGCLTNVASALLIAPDIVDKIVVIWTAGYPSADPRSNQPALNLVQDPHAVRVVLESGVPYVYMPGYTVGQQLTVSQPEMHAWVKGTGPLGNLLADLYDNNPLHRMLGIGEHFGRTWVIWDLICLAWLIDPKLVATTLLPTPALTTNLRWDLSHAGNRHVMREAIGVDRDGIFRDLFSKLRR